MKQNRFTSASLEQKIPVEPKALRIDPPRNDLIHGSTAQNNLVRSDVPRIDLTCVEPSYDTQREQSDRSRRRAEPEFQDGSYGFEPKIDRMDIDIDAGRNDRQKDPRENDGARGRGIGRDDRRLYSDDLYRRPRGRGYR